MKEARLRLRLACSASKVNRMSMLDRLLVYNIVYISMFQLVLVEVVVVVNCCTSTSSSSYIYMLVVRTDSVEVDCFSTSNILTTLPAWLTD